MAQSWEEAVAEFGGELVSLHLQVCDWLLPCSVRMAVEKRGRVKVERRKLKVETEQGNGSAEALTWRRFCVVERWASPSLGTKGHDISCPYWMPILWSNCVKRWLERKGSAMGSAPR